MHDTIADDCQRSPLSGGARWNLWVGWICVLMALEVALGALAGGDADGASNESRLAHWAFQPIQRPAVAIGIHPIDGFVQDELRAKGLSLSPPAPPSDLVRRIYLDLIGLPPAPDELASYLDDPAPDRYERLVERLLASPRYGERWGRHWLDLARYSESTGFEYDRLRDRAWPYRDYVIHSFNSDKPYDQFMREQIAGDILEPVTWDGLVAPSLLVCGAYDQAGNAQANATQRAITREEEMEDLLSVVGQTFLGLTVNCARCHDHKFDPIPQADYYRLKSVFDGVKHGERCTDTPAEAARRAEQIAHAEQSLAETQTEADRLDGLARNAICPAGETGLPLAEVLAWLEPEPRALRLRLADEIKKREAALAAVRVPGPMAYAGVRVQPEPTHRLRRGDVKSPGEVVTPGGLSAIRELPCDFGLAADSPEASRRLNFASWLADHRNPLPARVMANRVWQYHFGQGLVATPSDFGLNGGRPTHPALLDWLATTFMDSGWSVKALHRWIVTSATYRQSSEWNGQAARVDADDRMYWRFAPRRLEAEVVRDAMLAVSDQLNFKSGGASFRPFDTTDFNATFYFPVDRDDPEFNRRTVYRMNVNSGKEPFLDAFDCPDPSVKTPRRNITTTPLQALSLMNGSFVERQAARLSQRAERAAPGQSAGAIQAAYLFALGRPATDTELNRALDAVHQRGLTHVCWALLNSTEFVYVR